MKEINIHEFAEQYRKEYNFLYENCDNVAGYNEAVASFGEFARTESGKKFVGDFTLYNGDFISSDREAAAFMFALEVLDK